MFKQCDWIRSSRAPTSSCGSFIKQFSVLEKFLFMFWMKQGETGGVVQIERDIHKLITEIKLKNGKTRGICELTFSVDIFDVR